MKGWASTASSGIHSELRPCRATSAPEGLPEPHKSEFSSSTFLQLGTTSLSGSGPVPLHELLHAFMRDVEFTCERCQAKASGAVRRKAPALLVLQISRCAGGRGGKPDLLPAHAYASLCRLRPDEAS